jgi:threonine dehydrogenase-like Zn-dependent dehydrogenase
MAPFDMRLTEVDKPVVDDDTVIIKLEGLGICGSNLHWWYGGGPATALISYPMMGGGCHEYSGVVAEVGRNVKRVKPGDRVAIDQFESTACGGCFYCGTGYYSQCTNRRVLSMDGYVEYLKLTERGLYKLPDGIETHVAAVVQPYQASVGGIRRAGLQGGERVAVLGAGVLGLCAAGAAKALGAHRVVISAKYPMQKAMAERFNADAVVPSDADDLVARFTRELGGGADLVVETVGGHAPTLAQAQDIVRPAGTIVVVGLWDELVKVDSWKAVLKDTTFKFTLDGGLIGSRADYDLCLEWMANRKVPAQDLITHVFPLDRIADAFKTAADKKLGVLKVIVRP